METHVPIAFLYNWQKIGPGELLIQGLGCSALSRVRQNDGEQQPAPGRLGLLPALHLLLEAIMVQLVGRDPASGLKSLVSVSLQEPGLRTRLVIERSFICASDHSARSQSWLCSPLLGEWLRGASGSTTLPPWGRTRQARSETATANLSATLKRDGWFPGFFEVFGMFLAHHSSGQQHAF
ncbi:hypothetical protein LX36DRAFT_656603 [Colletotrichum falcatum]|nr:hypothetical protein LX36DRAFT_656603 [Colletotrichum falcatum]